jgi:mannose-6-phosphate isomerase-like protein (cupin superfamily)
MNIQRFIKEKASLGHSGTILASAFLPEGIKAPFEGAWGYLENRAAMEAHAHGTHEIYVVICGQGIMQIGQEERPVGPGDVIDIPPNAMHTIYTEDGGPLLWAALWWQEK